MKSLKDKPFVVIDLGSGSYLLENEGHEKYNEVRNTVTGKYYGYAPPKGKIDIVKLGAKKRDEYISNVMVIYVKKVEGSNNRYISSFIEDAIVYSTPHIDPSLNRTITQDGKSIECSFCVESNFLHSLEDIATKDKFIISLKDHSTSMFRKQRFYKGTYPDLDSQIIDYLEKISAKETDFDDSLFQQELQEFPSAPIPKMKHNVSSPPVFSEGANGQQVKKSVRVSKTALAIAKYVCEVSSEHKTFTNINGVPYMEGHHLIPCTPSNVRKYWKEFGVNIDCIENIICLCPTCHRLLHYGNEDERNELLKELFSIRKKRLEKIGLHISFDELIYLYS